MATIKVKLRQSSVVGRVGTIFYQLIDKKNIKQITTDIRLHPHEWDAIKEVVTTTTINREIIQNRIDCDIVLLKRIIHDLDKTKNSYSVNDIVVRYNSPKQSIGILDFMQNQIQMLVDANRLGTALNYGKTRKCFKEFLKGNNPPFTEMTECLIANYNVFLIQRGLVRNSISFYMRIMRAIYNKAVFF